MHMYHGYDYAILAREIKNITEMLFVISTLGTVPKLLQDLEIGGRAETTQVYSNGQISENTEKSL